MATSLPYLMIDFENVQPKAVERLAPGTARVFVFRGENQKSLSFELADALQPFGKDVTHVAITGTGPNAVDFHIAFYIGRIASAEPNATFVIVSKDRGFDPLVRHLGTLGIGCRRVTEIPETGPPKVASSPPAVAAPVPAAKAAAKAAPKPSTATTGRARAKVAIERLRKSTKPATVATLRSSIASYFKPALVAKEVDAVVQSLVDSKKIAVNGQKVTYTLG